MHTHDTVLEGLAALGLGTEEAKVYLELLRKPNTHAQLSHATGINRTNIYRLVKELEKKSLITRRTDDQGKFVVANDPTQLEVKLITHEEQVLHQRSTFDTILPTLTAIKTGGVNDFMVHTYEGVEGFKQMLWNELKTKGDVLIMGYGSIEDLVPSRRWVENYRQRVVEAGYHIYELANLGNTPENFTENTTYKEKTYEKRLIDRSLLPINQQTLIYNDTITTYGMQNGKRVGVEIICKTYAETLKVVFHHYWQLAGAQ